MVNGKRKKRPKLMKPDFMDVWTQLLNTVPTRLEKKAEQLAVGTRDALRYSVGRSGPYIIVG